MVDDTTNQNIGRGNEQSDQDFLSDDGRRGPVNVDEEDISQKEGPQLLTFGVPSVGKTVFHWHLLGAASKLGVKTRVLEQNGDQTSIALVNNVWRKLWRRGVLPPSTTNSTFLDISAEFVPSIGKKLPLELGIFEIPGESFVLGPKMSLDDYEAKTNDLDDRLLALLANKKIDLAVALVIHPHHLQASELAFEAFDRLIRTSFPDKVDIPILLILSAPDEARKVLADLNVIVHRQESIDKLATLFIDSMSDSLSRTIREEHRSVTAVTMDIGKVRTMDDEELTLMRAVRLGEPSMNDAELKSRQIVDELKLVDAKKVLTWLFSIFRGIDPFNEPPPTPMQRVKNYLVNVFK